ncbi:MAG: hypothetical protein ABI120_12770 [Gemmatimonadaceae bacterium]
MKRLALFAAFVSIAACAKKDVAVTDTTAMVAPAMAPAMDSQMMADSIKADSIKKADSIRMADSTKH